MCHMLLWLTSLLCSLATCLCCCCRCMGHVTMFACPYFLLRFYVAIGPVLVVVFTWWSAVTKTLCRTRRGTLAKTVWVGLVVASLLLDAFLALVVSKGLETKRVPWAMLHAALGLVLTLLLEYVWLRAQCAVRCRRRGGGEQKQS